MQAVWFLMGPKFAYVKFTRLPPRLLKGADSQFHALL